ncbi:MAG: hypothetical protein K1W05_06690 [Desulfovibrio sp.]|jgi:hypothetical protein
MKKYQYNGKEYDNLWLLRRDFRQFVFPRNPDDAALEAIGIICLMVKAGMPGLPQSVTWNAYRADGTLVRLELTADEFLALYAGGALAHKAACMEQGGAKKAELLEG